MRGSKKSHPHTQAGVQCLLPALVTSALALSVFAVYMYLHVLIEPSTKTPSVGHIRALRDRGVDNPTQAAQAGSATSGGTVQHAAGTAARVRPVPVLPGAFGVDSDASDPDAWLDYVADHPPPITPSHFGLVHGKEPFQLPPRQNEYFYLHTIPSDDWYVRARRAVDRCDLTLTTDANRWRGVDKGVADRVVWVSGLFDLRREELKGFKRPFKEYIERFQRVIDRGFPMVIFIPPEFEPMLNLDKSRIHVIHMNMEQLRARFPYYERLQAIRTSGLWQAQGKYVGWLGESPQAMLPDYNPLVMSKLFLLMDAARLNPFGARYHMWMDAGHFCVGGQRPEGTALYREHMSQGFFVTHWPYGTTTEVHGLTDKAMHIYMNQTQDPLLIVRGGIFGGTLPQIECVARAYVLALHQTLSDGYLGTEECIWAIIHKRFPELFRGFDNDSLGNHGDNCASFLASTNREEAIARGESTTFVSPPVPASAS